MAKDNYLTSGKKLAVSFKHKERGGWDKGTFWECILGLVVLSIDTFVVNHHESYSRRLIFFVTYELAK
jgi:hypothetical protein